MAKMSKPQVEAVRFAGTDVIATSGYPTLTLTGFDDYKKGNGTIVLSNGTTTKTFRPGDTDAPVRELYPKRPDGDSKYDGVGVAVANGNSFGFKDLSIYDSLGYPAEGANGVFTYDPNYNVNNYIWFVK